MRLHSSFTDLRPAILVPSLTGPPAQSLARNERANHGCARWSHGVGAINPAWRLHGTLITGQQRPDQSTDLEPLRASPRRFDRQDMCHGRPRQMRGERPDSSGMGVRASGRQLKAAWVGESVFSTPSLAYSVDIDYDSLSLDHKVLLEQIAPLYGGSSGLDLHEILKHGFRSRKRRRTDQRYYSMAPERTPSLDEGLQEKGLAPVQYDQYSDDQSVPSTSWTGSVMSTLPPAVSPLARRMADLSLLFCRNCNATVEHPEGYQQLPETPPMAYGPSRPYDVEKPPSMQIPPSATYSSGSLDLEQTSTFSYGQAGLTSPPIEGFSTSFQDQPPLISALANDVNPIQHGLPSPEYYTNQGLKQEPEMPSDQLLSQSQSSLPYGPDLLGYNSSPDLSHSGMASLDPMPNYGLIPAAQFSVPYPQQKNWTDVPLCDPLCNFDILVPNQRGGKRGPFKDPSLREQTAQTRKIGSCIRCRMQRIRCESNPDDPNGSCLTCQVPGYEWTRRWNNNISDPIQNWASTEIKVIRISEGLSNRWVEVRVRRFIPQDGDKLERTWDYKGKKKSVAIPPYALVDLEDGKRAYSAHIHDSMGETFSKLLGPTEGLLYKTYQLAWNMLSNKSCSDECVDVLERTLKLWISIRMSTRSGFIVGKETLGMSHDVLDKTSPNHGRIPVPPVLGAQLDLILIHHIQTKLRRELLEKLQKMMQKSKQNTWLVTYLVTFILLHNTSLITAHDAGYARKHGMKRRYAREDKVKEYHLGANVLLAHFHYCNKGVYPFSAECKDQELRGLAELDDEQIGFVHETREYAKQRSESSRTSPVFRSSANIWFYDTERSWADLRNQAAYEDDYFFTGQLFEENWQPRSTL
ncbi:hypothetical protein G7046_g7146 [Stylonectria norvegica]|nr:hypothetical protein G7046_g7146 [Stylonectria norvegica]